MEIHKFLLRYSSIDKQLHDPAQNNHHLLDELLGLLKRDKNDPLGYRNIIPHVLLETGREQECYDFIKWWNLHRSSETCSSSNVPFFKLNIKSHDACEDPSELIESGLSLSQLVALTHLKLRLFLDFEAISMPDVDLYIGLDSIDIGRSVGSVAEEKYDEGHDHDYFSRLKRDMRRQYLKLCEHVNEKNPHIWEGLATGIPPSACVEGTLGPGSTDEADLVLHHCRRSWEESEDALVMMEADTAKYIRAYKPPPVKKVPALQRRKGTGRAFPVGLKHKADSNSDTVPTTGFDTNKERSFLGNSTKLLLYTDGACLDNGQTNPRGGWAVSLGHVDETPSRVIAGRLEEQGPFKHPHPATSNRAELRAVIAALRLSNWKEEGFTSITIATDSVYVVSGATIWTKRWLSNGWRLNSGHEVKNRDLWELLLGEVERWKDQDVEVRLLSIPRHLNTEADAAAKEAARTKPDKVTFNDHVFRPPQPSLGYRKLQHCILAVSLGGGGFSEKPWLSSLLGMAPVKPVYDFKEAVQVLSGPNPPSMIFIGDVEISRHREVLERIIDVMHMGAKVIAGGSLPIATTGELARFFNMIGLPWERGDQCMSTVELQSGVQYDHLTNLLPRTISDKTCFIKGVEKLDCWYNDPDARAETAVAYTAIGSGRFGYIGCISNDETGVMDVVRVMLGLPLEVQTGL